MVLLFSSLGIFKDVFLWRIHWDNLELNIQTTMSSSLSMANQKIKQFFGSQKTKDYNLSVSKNDVDRSMEKVIAFCNCLRVYEETISALPSILQRLYTSFMALSLQSSFDAVEFQQQIHKCVRILTSLVEDQSGRYTSFAKFLNTEQETIKERFKMFNEARQKFDHYKSKTDGLMKDYVHQVDKNDKVEKIKNAKEVLDRNQLKLVNSENDYSKQLHALKDYLTTFQESTRKITLSTFTDTIRIGFKTITKMNDAAKDIVEFISKKIDKCNTGKRIPIEEYFLKKRQDNFVNSPNIFNDPKIHTPIPPPTHSILKQPQPATKPLPKIDFFGEIPSPETHPPVPKPVINIDFDSIFSNPPSLKPKTPTHKGPINANLLEFD